MWRFGFTSQISSQGKSFSFVVTGVSLWFVLNAFLKNTAPRRLMHELRLPLTYLAVICACYLSLLFVVANPFAIGQDLVNWCFFTPIRPGDNVIPWILGAKIYGREALIPFCCGDWLSSDRPPLEAGIFLFYWPLKLFDRAGLNHQLLGSGLQCSWCCGVWVLVENARCIGPAHQAASGLTDPVRIPVLQHRVHLAEIAGGYVHPVCRCHFRHGTHGKPATHDG